MFIPLRTDAPIYHWPWATLGLIIANVFAFALTGGGGEDSWDVWMLAYGDGLHPTQWVLNNFLHFGLFHLVGNMIFLWGFGLVVEGKIGWWRYLLVYFGIGIGQSLLEQSMMLGYDGLSPGSGGASAVIYGLLAMSLIWAPENEVTCGMLFFFRIFVFDLTIRTFALIYLGLELLALALNNFAMSSELIHLLGAVFGLIVGVGMLKLNWVDCENWDVFSVFRGDHTRRDEVYDSFGRLIGPSERATTAKSESGRKKKKNKKSPVSFLEAAVPFATARSTKNATANTADAPLSEKGLSRIVALLDEQEPVAALNEHRKLMRLNSDWRLPERELFKLAADLDRAGSTHEAIALMEEFLERFPADRRSVKVRLRLAQIAIKDQQRPRYALRLLSGLPATVLDDDSRRLRRSLEQRAQRLIDEGVLELDGQAWS
jgi:membrane associated rhomboid family serine protease